MSRLEVQKLLAEERAARDALEKARYHSVLANPYSDLRRAEERVIAAIKALDEHLAAEASASDFLRRTATGGSIVSSAAMVRELEESREIIERAKVFTRELLKKNRELEAALSSCWRIAEGQAKAKHMTPEEKLGHIDRIARKVSPPSVLREDLLFESDLDSMMREAEDPK